MGFVDAIVRMFTPSKSDNQSGAQYNAAYNAGQQAAAAAMPAAPTVDQSLAAAQVQADQRRKTILASGGTTATGAAGMGLPTTQQKTLLGS